MYGKDYNYADTRLRDSVVMHKGSPVLVHRVRADGAIVEPIGGGDYIVVPLQELDVKPIKLGYVNYQGTTSYIMRVPKRRDWRQGLRMSNIASIGYDVHSIPMGRMSHLFKNEYPTFKEACDKSLKKGDGRMAWSRAWSVSQKRELIYKEQVVGLIVEGQPLLSEDFQHLSESLKESLC